MPASVFHLYLSRKSLRITITLFLALLLHIHNSVVRQVSHTFSWRELVHACTTAQLVLDLRAKFNLKIIEIPVSSLGVEEMDFSQQCQKLESKLNGDSEIVSQF